LKQKVLELSRVNDKHHPNADAEKEGPYRVYPPAATLIYILKIVSISRVLWLYSLSRSLQLERDDSHFGTLEIPFTSRMESTSISEEEFQSITWTRILGNHDQIMSVINGGSSYIQY
jgi:hypothetical protein